MAISGLDVISRWVGDYLQGVFFEATGCSLDQLQPVVCWFFIFQNERATGLLLS